MKIASFILASVLASCSTTTALADSLLAIGPSIHATNEVNGHVINNATYGIGYEHAFTDNWSAQVLVYHNSFNSTSFALTGSYTMPVLANLSAGVMLGLASGYEADQVPHLLNSSYSAIGGIVLNLAVTDKLSIGVVHMPDVCPECTTVTTLLLKVTLQ